MTNASPDMHVSFQTLQSEFTDYIRDPLNKPLPDNVKKQRMTMYRELCFNNINSFLTSNFPVLKQILDEPQWQALTQDFFNTHSSKSPYFSQIPEEFIHYLQHERETDTKDPPFMLELAHYEWVEMVLSIAKANTPPKDKDLIANPLHYKISLSPLAWPLLYQYPVHLITPEFQPAQPPEQPTYLLVYRDVDFTVRFLVINAITFRLLQILQEQGEISAAAGLRLIAQELTHATPEVVVNGGKQILQEMAEKSIVCKAG